MANLAEIEAALRNADAAGDAEGARVLAAEYKRMQAQPTERPGALERGAKGVAMGFNDPRDALNQLVTRAGAAVGLPGAERASAFWDRDIKARNAAYQQDVRGGQPDFDFGRLTGNMAGTAPLSAAMPAPTSLARALVGGAASGGLFGGLQPVVSGDFMTEKAKQVGTGAAAGAVMAPLTYGLSRIISPTSSPEVRALRAEGVTPTPGQMLGGGFKTAEEKLTSVPILGAAIKAGQGRAIGEMNDAAIQRALTPVGERLPKGATGYEAIEFARKTLGAKYDDALSAIGPIKLDPQFSTDLRAIYAQLSGLPKDKAEQFARILETEIAKRGRNGVLTPEAIKAAESEIGRQARGYMRAQDFDVQKLGEALDLAQDKLREMIARQAPRGTAENLQKVNAGYAAFKRVQRAASYVGAEDGVFNPNQLTQSVRALDRTKDHRAFAEGTALMQDLSSASKKVLANKIPNSGTADRALGAAALMTPLLDAGAVSGPLLGGAGLGSLLYTPVGQKAMAGLLGSRPEGAATVAEMVRRLGLPAGMALTPALQGLLSQ
jgi:hypothetical protein